MGRAPWGQVLCITLALWGWGGVGLGGCSGGGQGAEDAGADAGEPDAAPERYPIHDTEATWRPCSLYPGQDDGLAECAFTALPLHWEDPQGPSRFIVAKRLLAVGGGEAQYWLVNGGPGMSGLMHHPALMEALQRVYPQLDVYTYDQRGTGRSDYLECPEQMSPGSVGGEGIDVAEAQNCVAALLESYGTDHLNGTTTTQSAIDLAAYIEASRVEGVPVFVRGLSYGTYLVQRYLQIFPAQADGIVLEGMMPPDDTMMSFSEGQNTPGHDLMDLCGRDPFCASQLGSDPWSYLGEALEGLTNGDCQNVAYHPDWFRALLPTMMYDHWLNSAVPAVAYRLHRCAPEDGVALEHTINQFFGPGTRNERYYYSAAMQLHTNLSEIWHHPDYDGIADLDQYFADVSATTFFDSRAPSYYQSMDPFWPTYEDAEYDDGWPTTALPMLMMQGQLDPATPYFRAIALADYYTAPHQHWVTFPEGSHHLITGTPLPSDPERDHCALQLQVAFIQDPLAAPDTSCVDEVLPMDFRGTPALARELFDTDDFFALGSGTPPPPRPPSAVSPSLRRALQAARQRLARLGSPGLVPPPRD